MSTRTLVIISLFIASIFWASAGTVSKLLFPAIDPIPVMMLRLGVATVILLPIFFRKKHPPIKQILIDTLPISLAAAANFLLFIIGVSKTTADASTIIYTAIPILTLLIAKTKIHEAINTQKLVGVLLGLTGTTIILLLPLLIHKQSLNGSLTGNLIIFCALIFWTYYIVGSRQLVIQKHYSSLTIATSIITISFLSMLILTIFVPHRSLFPAVLTGIYPLLIIYYGIGVTVVTFMLQQWIIEYSSASTASLTNYLQPIFAFMYNAIFLGERLTPEFLIGSILVLGGTMLATGGQTKEFVRSFIARRRNG